MYNGLERLTFYDGSTLITNVECSLFYDRFYKTPVFKHEVFYIGQITIVVGRVTFNIVCYDDAS